MVQATTVPTHFNRKEIGRASCRYMIAPPPPIVPQYDQTEISNMLLILSSYQNATYSWYSGSLNHNVTIAMVGQMVWDH